LNAAIVLALAIVGVFALYLGWLVMYLGWHSPHV
jgi:hypothetical protein